MYGDIYILINKVEAKLKVSTIHKINILKYPYNGNFCGNLISAVFCGQLRTAEIKIAEYYVKQMFNVPYKIRFQTLNSDSAVSVKYSISRNYYIQINKTWYYINVYTTIKGYLAVA